MLKTPKGNNFWFLPLGGAGEIGMNLNLFGHNKEWIIVDCGITFGDRLGIDIMMPDPSAILEQAENVKALVLTHAHEDHIGAVPYLWPYLKCPVYATPFTAQVLRQKLEEKSWGKQVKIIEVPLSGRVQIGSFDVEYITLTHSIPEPNALAIRTELGCVLHTGDWKVDPQPLIGESTDKNRLKEIGKEGVSALICDSTNVFDKGSTGSEGEVRNELEKIIAQIPQGRIVACCFSSNVARVESIAHAAQKNGRKVALLGRSLEKMIRAATLSGYLKKLPGFVPADQAMDMPRDKVLFISTGSQGEGRAALSRIANRSHPIVELDDGDTVIFSSRVIPGNERSIANIQNQLVHQGVRTITSHEEAVHVSGHPAQEDLKAMYNWTKPKSLIPVHGEARHMQSQAELGLANGIEHTLVPGNGTLIELAGKTPEIIDRVNTGRWGVDGKCLVSMQSPILKDRNKISIQGIVLLSIPVDDIYQLQGIPVISSFGLVELGEETEDFQDGMQKIIRRTMHQDLGKEKNYIEALQRSVKQECNQRFGKKPVVDIHFVSVS
ncbi:MAG: ribonuclease J [Pseudomonadota bacterium]|nr:ribonuclease J [Alphaproteobacteria bacterium]